MKTIPLTQGKVALVDDEDYEFLNQFTWYGAESHGLWYAETKISGKNVKMHRLLIPDAQMVDHEDQNGCNNQRHNLRPCTNSQNLANRGPTVNNTSGYKGVDWFERDQKWRARIMCKGTYSHLGYFDCKIKAAKAYNYAAKCLFGEFAKLNEV